LHRRRPCNECKNDYGEWYANVKHSVCDYLTEEEIKIYQKCNQLKKLIVESLGTGDKEINWKKMQKDGQLSGWDEDVFADKLK
jgi:hypothetical protein